jgi:hypothetical protein
MTCAGSLFGKDKNLKRKYVEVIGQTLIKTETSFDKDKESKVKI